MLQPDYSTIDFAALRAIPALSPGLHFDRDYMGAACEGDPPGYPSYFVRYVYNSRGDSPSRGTQSIILAPDGTMYEAAWERDGDWQTADLRAAWRPLPLDHPRVRQWVWRTYQHNGKCWLNPKYGGVLPPGADDGVLIPSIDYLGSRSPAYPVVTELGGVLSEWYMPTRMIRRYYPDFIPTQRLLRWSLRNDRRLFQADWWERYAVRPAEADCPGHHGTPHARGMAEFHSCRMCGRRTKGA